MAKKESFKTKQRSLKSIIIISILIIGLISTSTAILQLLMSARSVDLPRSIPGGPLEDEPADLVPITFDPSMYTDIIMNSSLLDDLAEQIAEDPEAFMDQYGDQLADMFEGLSGSNFDASMFDDFPTDVLLAVFGLPVFWAYDESGGAWTEPGETFFKTTSYDLFDTTSFEWKASPASTQSDIVYEIDLSDVFWKIKYMISMGAEVSTAIPSTHPDERILDSSLIQEIPTLSNPEVKVFNENGGISYAGGYASEYSGLNTNISYNLLYDPGDYNDHSYYQANSIDMASYTESNALVEANLVGPGGEPDWDTYFATHENFRNVVIDLAATTTIGTAATAYEKMQTILDYVGLNFDLDPQTDQAPADGEDPIEFTCGVKVSRFPYHITSVIVSLARYYDISARYTSGFKWNWDDPNNTGTSFLETNFGGAYDDPDESNQETHCYRIAHSYSWPEVFIPTGPSAGEWITFDNNYSVDAGSFIGFGGTVDINTQIDGDYLPDILTGHSRGSLPFNIEVLDNGVPVTDQNVFIYDTSYDGFIDNITTDENGTAAGTIDTSVMVAGPHLLNFTTFVGSTWTSNLTIVNVLGQVDTIMERFSPNITDTVSNPTLDIQVQGYAWDPVIEEPVRNAIISEIGFHYPDLIQVDLLPTTTITNSIGNYTFDTSLYGQNQGYVAIASNFTGAFDIYDDLMEWGQIYADNIPNQIPSHTAYLSGDYDTMEIFDPLYLNTTFSISGTMEGDYSANGGNPLVMTRTTGAFILAASTWQGTGFKAGNIEVNDLTEGRTITTLVTDAGSGYDTGTIILNTEAPTDWRAGPHLIQFLWTDSPNPGSSESQAHVWIFIHEDGDILHTETTVFTGNQINMDTDGYGDDFTISGILRDDLTGEVMAGATMEYGLIDQVTNDVSNYLSPYNIYTTMPTSGEITRDFRIDPNIPVTATHIRTIVNTTGEWNDLGHSWDNAWNSLWASTYDGLAVQSNLCEVLDPTNSLHEWKLDTVDFQNSYFPMTAHDYIDGDTGTIAIYFEYQYYPGEGGSITVTDETIPGVLATGTTNAAGSASIPITFGTGNDIDHPGAHFLRVDFAYYNSTNDVTITRTDHIYVIYNDTLTMTSSGGGVNLISGDQSSSMTITGTLTNGVYSYLDAELTAWVIFGGSTYLASTYFDMGPSGFTYNPDGSYEVSLTALGSAPIGDYQIICGFDGTLPYYPTDPSLWYVASNQTANATALSFSVYDKPDLSSSYTFTSPGDLPYLVPGGSYVNISGYLEYSNGTAITGQTVSIDIIDSDDTIVGTYDVVTGALGYYEELNIYIQIGWEPKEYTVSYSGSPAAYLLAADGTGETFP